MKKILIIIPYFGPMPNYFKLWLESAKCNSTVNFLIITDNQIENCPPNIKLLNCTFEELRNEIKSKFNFEINLEKPYDLCKYKPAYGDIFSKYVKEYDFWGYCDIDLIFGDLRKFLTDEILENHEKILSHGHLCLYKNNKKLNELYKVKRKDCFYYKDVFTSKISWNNFDEYPYGVSRIAKMEGIKVYEKDIFADLDTFFYTFRKIYSYFPQRKDDPVDIIQYFTWKEGKLFNKIINNCTIDIEELAYVHFQKRNMNCSELGKIEKNFDIFPNKFLPIAERKIDIIRKICDTSQNDSYCKNFVNEIKEKIEKIPFYKKLFSMQRLKRKIFLLKMKKIYKVEPYKFDRGGF